MSNQTTIDWPFIRILFGAVGDPADWDLQTIFGDSDPELVKSGMRVISAQTIPSATNDAIVVRNTANANQTSAPIIQEIAMSKYDIARRRFHGQQRFWPAVHADDVTDGVILLLEVIKA